MVYEYWLAALPGIGSGKKKLLRQRCGNAKEVFYMKEKSLNSLHILKEAEAEAVIFGKKEGFREEYSKMTEDGISFVPWFCETYPKRLESITNPPYALYVKGRLPKDDIPSAAIVGARRCTPYGEAMALEYGEALAKSGVQVISGMARGIDGAGQRGALNGKGSSFGVLGSGTDVCYPRENWGLYMDLQKKGGVLSEQIPGSRPLPGYFPARNRIISGLSDIVLIIEAKEKSGSLITADMALEQGKDVYALPGPVTSPLSRGCHRLIAQGAGILFSVEEFLRETGLSYAKVAKITNKNEKMLESTEDILYSCLGFTPKSVEQLSEETAFSARKVLEGLITLELQGVVKEISKNYYMRIR